MTKRGTMTMIRTIACLMAVALPAVAQDLDSALNDIKGYTFGQSREGLTAVHNLVVDALATPETQATAAASLAAVLSTDATLDCKQFVCRELAVAATAAEVEAIGELFDDPETSDMARYALATLDAPGVDDELIDALEDSDDATVVAGVASTLGRRGTSDAANVLGRLARGDDETVAIAAATALGHIGGTRAERFLRRAEDAARPAVHRAVLDARQLSADDFREAGNTRKARRIYRDLMEEDNPAPVRRAAFIGLLHASDDVEDLLEDVEEGDDALLKAVAAHYTTHLAPKPM